MSLAEREDMTINEAIMKSELGMTYSDAEHDQLIEWLEELKHYQLGDCMNDCEHYDNCSNYIYSKGYNKAIDDFAEMVIAELQKAKHEIKLNENDLDIYRGAMICAIETVKDIKVKLQS